jgi:hypothetical protein
VQAHDEGMTLRLNSGLRTLAVHRCPPNLRDNTVELMIEQAQLFTA